MAAPLSKVEDFPSVLDLIKLFLRACSPEASSDVGWRTLGAHDMREEVVEERGMDGACLLQLSLPPLRGEATLLSSYSHEVSIVTRLRS